MSMYINMNIHIHILIECDDTRRHKGCCPLLAGNGYTDTYVLPVYIYTDI